MPRRSSKRRRVGDDPEERGNSEEEVVPPDVVSSFGPPAAAVVPGGDAAGGEVPAGVDLLQPELTEIAKVVFHMQKNDVEEVVAAMKKLDEALGEGNEDSEENAKEAIKMGAHVVALGTMRKWQMHEDIQTNGCGILIELMYNCDDAEGAVVQLGGLEAAINAMRVFPDSEHVNRRASRALRNMYDESVRTSARRRFVDDLNGLPLLLRVMKKFPNQSGIQEDCCVVFYQLAQEKELRKPLVETGVVSAVATTMERHLEEKEVKEWADEFMKAMYSSK